MNVFCKSCTSVTWKATDNAERDDRSADRCGSRLFNRVRPSVFARRCVTRFPIYPFSPWHLVTGIAG